MPTFTLVTDALSPLGRREAASLAARGKNVVLLGDMSTVLSELAAELRVLHEVDVRALTIDLGAADATREILAWLRQTEIRLDGVVCVRASEPVREREGNLQRGLDELEEALSATVKSQGVGFVWRVNGPSAPRTSSIPPARSSRRRKSTARGHNDPSS